MRNTEKLINKPVYLKLSILELNRIFMHEFCKTKIKWKSKIVHRKRNDIYKEIAKDVETRFDT